MTKGGTSMTFGERLRIRRKELGLTRAELANMVGVTMSAIGNYELNISHPKLEILYKLFDALDTSPNYLFQNRNEEEKSNQSNIIKIKQLKESVMTDILTAKLDTRQLNELKGIITVLNNS